LDIRVQNADTFAGTFSPNGTDGVYLWGAQLNRGIVPTAYISTTTAARIGVPISYGQGLLVEPAATNLLTRSQELGSAGIWSQSNVTLTTDNAVAPDGSTTAETLTANGSNASHSVTQTITTTADATYTYSVYAKAGTEDCVYLRNNGGVNNWWTAIFDLDGGGSSATQTAVGATSGTIVSTSQVDLGNGWVRLTVTGSITPTSSGMTLGVAETPTGYTFSTQGTPTPNSSSGTILYWGAQHELGTVATSYIPTVSATATRAVDAVTVATNTFPYGSGSSNSVIAWITGRITNDAVLARIFEIDDAVGAEIVLVGAITGDTPDSFGVAMTAGSVAQVAAGTTKTGSYNLAGNKVGVAWATNNTGIVVDGSAEVTDTSCTVAGASITTIRFGYSFITGSREFNGFIRRFITVPRRMTEAQMQAKTT
jgi:hypothetical protein